MGCRVSLVAHPLVYISLVGTTPPMLVLTNPNQVARNFREGSSKVLQVQISRHPQRRERIRREREDANEVAQSRNERMWTMCYMHVGDVGNINEVHGRGDA